MKNKTLFIISLLCTLFLAACGSKYNEEGIYTLEVGGKYILAQFSEDETRLTARFEGHDYGNALAFEGDFIPNKIVEFSHNDDYILAKQLDVSDASVKEKDSPVYWWVVETQNEYVHGPLTKEEFDDIINTLDLKKLEKSMKTMKEHIDEIY